MLPGNTTVCLASFLVNKLIIFVDHIDVEIQCIHPPFIKYFFCLLLFVGEHKSYVILIAAFARYNISINYLEN